MKDRVEHRKREEAKSIDEEILREERVWKESPAPGGYRLFLMRTLVCSLPLEIGSRVAFRVRRKPLRFRNDPYNRCRYTP